MCGWHHTEISSFILFFCLPLYIAFHSFVNIVDTSNTCSINIDAKKKKLNQIDNFLSTRTHVCYMRERATPDGVQTWSSGYFPEFIWENCFTFISLFLWAPSSTLPREIHHILWIYQFIPFYFTPCSWALSWAEMPGCLPHFLSSWVKWGRKEGKSGRRGAAGDCTGFVGVGNFSFSSLSACLASLCTFNNAFPVHTAAVVVVCRYFVSNQCLTILLFCFNYSILFRILTICNRVR